MNKPKSPSSRFAAEDSPLFENTPDGRAAFILWRNLWIIACVIGAAGVITISMIWTMVAGVIR